MMKNENLIVSLIESLQKQNEGLQKQIEVIQKSLDRIENNQIREKSRLDEVYFAREKVKITFGWQWGMVSLFIAIGAATIVKILA